MLVALAIYRRPAPLALLVAATCIAPVVDVALVATAPHGGLGYALGGHGSAAAYCAVTAALLWRTYRRACAGPVAA